MVETRVRLLYDACRQSGRDSCGANCAVCTLYDMWERQLTRVERRREAIIGEVAERIDFVTADAAGSA